MHSHDLAFASTDQIAVVRLTANEAARRGRTPQSSLGYCVLERCIFLSRRKNCGQQQSGNGIQEYRYFSNSQPHIDSRRLLQVSTELHLHSAQLAAEIP